MFTWSGGPWSGGVGFCCFVSPRAWKQKKPTPLDRGPPLHVNRPLVSKHTHESWVACQRDLLGFSGLRYSQKAPGGLALTHEQSVNVNEQNMCDSWVRKSLDCRTVSFFLKIGVAWLSHARGARASHDRLSPVSLSVSTLASVLTAHACLISQKYGLFCSLEKVHQSINPSIRLSIYLYLTLLILAESLQQQSNEVQLLGLKITSIYL